MGYSLILGDLGPPLPIQLTDDGAPFVLQAGDVVVLRYLDPGCVEHEVPLVVLVAATGSCQAEWSAGDLPLTGYYRGLVVVERSSDPTFPRSFPDDGSRVIWPVNPAVSGTVTPAPVPTTSTPPFYYACTGAEAGGGMLFPVTIPTRPDTNYSASATLQKSPTGSSYGCRADPDSFTTTSIMVDTDVPVGAGDVLLIRIEQLL